MVMNGGWFMKLLYQHDVMEPPGRHFEGRGQETRVGKGGVSGQGGQGGTAMLHEIFFCLWWVI